MQYELGTTAGLRGRVVPGEVETVENSREQACPTCTVHVTVRKRRNPTIEAIHADAVLMDGAAWVLGHDAPGSTRPILYRYPMRGARPGAGVSWRLAEPETRPRSLWVGADTLYVASEDALYRFETPRWDAPQACAAASRAHWRRSFGRFAAFVTLLTGM